MNQLSVLHKQQCVQNRLKISYCKVLNIALIRVHWQNKLLIINLQTFDLFLWVASGQKNETRNEIFEAESLLRSSKRSKYILSQNERSAFQLMKIIYDTNLMHQVQHKSVIKNK